jgi:DNA/RNA endonuclease YhcR with UshA esterase domain
MKTLRLVSASLSLALGLAFAGSFSAVSAAETPRPAQSKIENQKSKIAKPYPLKTCLVTDNDLGSMGEETTLIYDGQVIKFCCKPCEAKFLKDPAKYLAKLATESAAASAPAKK